VFWCNSVVPRIAGEFSGSNQRTHLIIFNLETNPNSEVLATNIFWIKEFAKHFKSILVYSTHLSNVQDTEYIKFRKIGGGNIVKRIKGTYLHYLLIPYLVSNRKRLCIFYHMNTKSMALISFYGRILGVRQGLWYSHSRADKYLKIFRVFVNYFFSPTKNSFPLTTSSKLIATNHGIPMMNLPSGTVYELKRNGILSVGRVVRIKNLQKIILAASESKLNECTLTFLGPQNIDIHYENDLRSLAKQHELKLELLSAVNYQNLPFLYPNYDLYFTGTPKSIDKATIEAAVYGCIIITDNLDAQKLTGMDRIWDELGLSNRTNLSAQLNCIKNLDEMTKYKCREYVSRTTRELNSLELTVSKISAALKS
jgi:hypothetical protein